MNSKSVGSLLQIQGWDFEIVSSPFYIDELIAMLII